MAEYEEKGSQYKQQVVPKAFPSNLKVFTLRNI